MTVWMGLEGGVKDIIITLQVWLWEGGGWFHTSTHELQEQKKWLEVTNDMLPLESDFLLENPVEMPIY